MKTAGLFLILLLSAAGLVHADRADTLDEQERIYPYLREGFLYNGVNGTVSRNDENGKWNFAADTDLTDTRGVIKTGNAIELLLSGCLENMIAEAGGDENSLNVKLWAKVARYSNRNLIDPDIEEHEELVFDKNYLFPMLFIPMSDVERQPPAGPAGDDADAAADKIDNPAESSSDSIIPTEVMEKLKPRRLPNLAKLKTALKQHGDITIFDRSGFIRQTKAGKIFELDGLGRGVDGVIFQLLNSETLERVERKLGDSPGRLRFRVAGIVTKYKNNYYLLLQRAARTYNNGNFAK
jgi:hypothetical protein